MGRSLVYTGSRHYSAKRRRTSQSNVYVGPTAFRFVALAALAVMAALYIETSAHTSSQTAALHSLSTQSSSLNDRLDALQVESTRQDTASRIKDQANNIGMTQAGTQLDLKK